MTTPTLDLDTFDVAYLTDPYAYHDQILDAGAVFWMPKYAVWGTGRHDQSTAVLKDWKTFCSSSGVGLANFKTETPFRPPSLILEADPPEHTRARGVLGRAMSQKSVADMGPQFERDADELISRLIAAGDIDGVSDLAAAYSLRVFPDAVGIERQGRENLLIYGNMVFNSFGPHNEVFTASTAQMGRVTEWILAHCARDKISDGGMGAAIYDEVEGGTITSDEAALLVRSLLTAGIDTTVAGIGNALLCFAEHPDQWQKLRRDPSQAKHAFEEVLRYTSPVQSFFRTTTEATEIGGIEIAENEKILVFMGAANRDPRRWDNADVFDIERRPTGHLAFGAGVHRCVGQRVAQVEGEIILQKLAERVSRIELTAPPVWRPNNTIHTLDTLALKLVA